MKQTVVRIAQPKKYIIHHSYVLLFMQEALYDIPIKQLYLYPNEIIEFLYYRFREKISKRSVGQDYALSKLDKNNDPSNHTTMGFYPSKSLYIQDIAL